MSFDLGDELKKVLFAGIGAVAITAEKAQEMVDELVKKGELTAAEGKAMNEELSRKFKKKVKDTVDDNAPYSVTIKEKADINDLVESIDSLSEEDLKKLKEKLKEMDTSKESDKGKKKSGQ